VETLLVTFSSHQNLVRSINGMDPIGLKSGRVELGPMQWGEIDASARSLVDSSHFCSCTFMLQLSRYAHITHVVTRGVHYFQLGTGVGLRVSSSSFPQESGPVSLPWLASGTASTGNEKYCTTRMYDHVQCLQVSQIAAS